MERRNYRRRDGNTNGYNLDYENGDDDNYNFGKMENKMKKKKNLIGHPVSKLDTLAGIAIKYGVDVADIKKLNGLSTDLQMFALETLQIPIPGKHPPFCLSNAPQTPGQTNYGQTPHHHRVHHKLFDSFHSLRLRSTEPKISPAMIYLQSYYGLEPAHHRRASEGCEMTFHRKREAWTLKDGPSSRPSPSSHLPLGGCHRKSRSLANVMLTVNGGLEDNILSADGAQSQSDKWNEKLVRRCQKFEADYNARTPEMLLEDNTSTVGFPAITGKSLALRPKAANRIALGTNAEGYRFNPVPSVLGGPLPSDTLFSVRKSSSTSSLQDQDANSIWPTPKWSLKPDLLAFSSVAITKPIFDGSSNPITGRKNKAALD